MLVALCPWHRLRTLGHGPCPWRRASLCPVRVPVRVPVTSGTGVCATWLGAGAGRRPSFLSPLKEELENFALPTVRHCQTVLNQLRYPSVLLLVCQDSEQSRPDVHFFHCDEVEVSRAAGRAPRPEPA